MRAAFTTLLITLASGASAQAPSPLAAPEDVRRVDVVPGAGLIARGTGTANPFVYSNREDPSAWYPQCGLETFYDTGRLPSDSSLPIVGGRTSYRIDALELGYVTAAPDVSVGGTGVPVELRFWSLGSECDVAADLGPPVAVLDLVGLPGSTLPGSFQTIVASIDLAAAGLDFDLAADGDGVYDHDPSQDLFVWSIRFPEADGSTGPLFAGDPIASPDGAATAWSSAPGEGTGLGSRDSFRIETNGAPSACGLNDNCVDFQGLFDAFYLGLRADPGVTPSAPGYSYCFGVACPCGNEDRDRGCSKGAGGGAFLWGAGTSSVAADDLILTATGMTPFTFAVLFHGGGATGPIDFGNGSLCVGPGGGSLGLYRYGGPIETGPIGSFSVLQIVSRSQAFPADGQIDAGETWYFQAWYRDSGACGQGSNMTSAYAVTFQP